MTDPITPPPELVQQWLGEFFGCTVDGELSSSEFYLATRAAQWGADQELEACCAWVQGYAECGDSLRAARRPKPPSLKEQALARLASLEKLVADLERAGLVPFHDKDDSIRRALEELPDN